MPADILTTRNRVTHIQSAWQGCSADKSSAGRVRRVPVRSDLPFDLPVSAGEIQMLSEAMGSIVAALFDEDD